MNMIQLLKQVVLFSLILSLTKGHAQLVAGSGDGGKGGKPMVPVGPILDTVEAVIKRYFPITSKEMLLIEAFKKPKVKLKNILDVYVYLSLHDSIEKSEDFKNVELNDCKEIKKSKHFKKVMTPEVQSLIVQITQEPLLSGYLMNVHKLSEPEASKMIANLKELSTIDQKDEEKP